MIFLTKLRKFSDSKKDDVTMLPDDFNETIYLALNSDVAIAIRSREIESGAAHYLKHGRNEGRKYNLDLPHYIKDYKKLVRSLLAEFPDNIDLALSKAIGCHSIENFEKSGDLQFDILSILGLKDGMVIYDLGCGCGRTAQALQRNGWSGNYFGADIIEEFITHLKSKCNGYSAAVNFDQTILSPDNSLDIIYSWSLFTHLEDEEIYLYMQDGLRALRSGGKLIFSFLEHGSSQHANIFTERVNMKKSGVPFDHLDTFIHRDFIKQWALTIGYSDQITFLDGHFKFSKYGSFFQSIAILTKK